MWNCSCNLGLIRQSVTFARETAGTAPGGSQRQETLGSAQNRDTDATASNADAPVRSNSMREAAPVAVKQREAPGVRHFRRCVRTRRLALLYGTGRSASARDDTAGKVRR